MPLGGRHLPDRLSIAYVSPSWPASKSYDGITTAIGIVAPTVASRGHRVRVFSWNTDAEDPGPDQFVYKLDRYSGRTLADRARDWIGFKLAPFWAADVQCEQALVRGLMRGHRDHAIDVVEMEESFGWVRRLCEQTPMTVVIRLHGPWFLNGTVLGAEQDANFQRRIEAEGRAIRAAHGINAPSLDVLERTRAYYNLALPDAEVIPATVPAVSPDLRWRLDRCDPKSILFVGRFDRHKGGDVMIEAFGRVLERMPDAQLWFVGPDRGCRDDDGRTWQIEEFCRERVPGALEQGRIHCLGFQPPAKSEPYRQRSLVTVMPSRYDNCPAAVIEALARGCPIVSSRVGGIPELITDGVDGLLHRPGDPEDLASKLLTLLEQPSHAAELGRRAAETFDRRFHPEVLADRWVDFYRRVIASRQRR